MNKRLIIPWIAVMAAGCSAPQAFVAETEGQEQEQRVSLSRVQTVAQLQVDATSVYGQLIEYVADDNDADGRTTTAPASDAGRKATRTRRIEAALAFRPGTTRLQPEYGGNSTELARLRTELAGWTDAFSSTPGMQLQALRITGYASPDGSTAQNEQLALGRALQFRNYLERELAIPAGRVTVDRCSEDWDGLLRLATEAHKPYAGRLDSVLQSTVQPDARRKALKKLAGGRVWKDMEQSLFARLRRMSLEVVYEEPVPVETAGVLPASGVAAGELPRLLSLLDSDPGRLSLDELLALAPLFRPGTEQFREVYELAAYRFPDCAVAQLNAGAAALAAGDGVAARFFLARVEGDPRAWINTGVLALMEGNRDEAVGWFRKALPVRPRQARRCLEMMEQLK
ncbi:hypothetical protein [Parabacteroides sp.]